MSSPDDLGAPQFFVSAETYDEARGVFSIGPNALRATSAAREHIESARQARERLRAFKRAERGVQ